MMGMFCWSRADGSRLSSSWCIEDAPDRRDARPCSRAPQQAPGQATRSADARRPRRPGHLRGPRRRGRGADASTAASAADRLYAALEREEDGRTRIYPWHYRAAPLSRRGRRPHMISSHHLPVFDAVAREGSLGAAAHAARAAPSRRCRITSPRSRPSSNTTLFVRGRRGVELTDRGRVLRDHAQLILSQLVTRRARRARLRRTCARAGCASARSPRPAAPSCRGLCAGSGRRTRASRSSSSRTTSRSTRCAPGAWTSGSSARRPTTGSRPHPGRLADPAVHRPAAAGAPGRAPLRGTAVGRARRARLGALDHDTVRDAIRCTSLLVRAARDAGFELRISGAGARPHGAREVDRRRASASGSSPASRRPESGPTSRSSSSPSRSRRRGLRRDARRRAVGHRDGVHAAPAPHAPAAATCAPARLPTGSSIDRSMLRIGLRRAIALAGCRTAVAPGAITSGSVRMATSEGPVEAEGLAQRAARAHPRPPPSTRRRRARAPNARDRAW